MRRFFSITALVAAFLLVPGHSFAGSFHATPLKMYIDAKSKTEVLRITNQGDENVTVQIDIKTWAQDHNGRDIYGETADIVVFPKMASIEKDETRIFRVGYSGSPATQEQTYRIFVQELPVSKPGEMALKFALTMSLPVFVAPAKEMVDWSAEAIGIAQESLQVKVTNRGNRHVMIEKLKATGFDAAGTEVFSQDASGWYTLGGQSRTFPINVPYQECLKAARIQVEVHTKESNKRVELPVNKSMCTRKPETVNTGKTAPARARQN